jgi:hypothetical protein
MLEFCHYQRKIYYETNISGLSAYIPPDDYAYTNERTELFVLARNFKVNTVYTFVLFQTFAKKNTDSY